MFVWLPDTNRNRSSSIVKFANDTAVTGWITNNYEKTCLKRWGTCGGLWCKANNLLPNDSKIKTRVEFLGRRITRTTHLWGLAGHWLALAFQSHWPFEQKIKHTALAQLHKWSETLLFPSSWTFIKSELEWKLLHPFHVQRCGGIN